VQNTHNEGIPCSSQGVATIFLTSRTRAVSLAGMAQAWFAFMPTHKLPVLVAARALKISRFPLGICFIKLNLV